MKSRASISLFELTVIMSVAWFMGYISDKWWHVLLFLAGIFTPLVINRVISWWIKK